VLGTWISVAQLVPGVPQARRTFIVTCGNMILAAGILITGDGGTALDLTAGRKFWLPVVGGILWSLGNNAAFVGTANIGVARASGIWTPLNILTAFFWGIVLFGEMRGVVASTVVELVGCLVLIGIGLALILRAQGSGSASASGGTALLPGVVGAVLAGVLWGTYFIPAQAAHVSAQEADFPLAIGMVVGGAALAWRKDGSDQTDDDQTDGDVVGRSRSGTLILLFAGVMWGVGNLAALHLVAAVGAGRGFTIAQLSLPVNALLGIYLFRNPAPRTRAAWVTQAGVLIAGVGGVLLGTLK
jgi:glucose uptake protein